MTTAIKTRHVANDHARRRNDGGQDAAVVNAHAAATATAAATADFCRGDRVDTAAAHGDLDRRGNRHDTAATTLAAAATADINRRGDRHHTAAATRGDDLDRRGDRHDTAAATTDFGRGDRRDTAAAHRDIDRHATDTILRRRP